MNSIGTGRPVGRNWGGASVGIGIVEGSAPDEASFTTAGLAADAQLISGRFPHLALAAVGNANPKASFAAVTLSILLGRMPFGGGFTQGRPRW